MRFLSKIIEYKLPKAGLRVLDVGYGKGLEALKLAELGCIVDAVDPKGDKIENPNIKIFNNTIEEFDLSQQYGLVIAQNVLFFIESPLEMAQKLLGVITKDGVLCISFLGEKDAWCGKENIFCITEKDINELKSKIISDGNEVIFFQEELGLGSTMAGPLKNWHVYSLIVRKK